MNITCKICAYKIQGRISGKWRCVHEDAPLWEDPKAEPPVPLELLPKHINRRVPEWCPLEKQDDL